YRIAVELTAFTRVERELTFGAPPCDTTVEIAMSLQPRRASAAAQPDSSRPATAGSRPATARAETPSAAAPAQPRPQAGAGRGAAAAGRGGERFQTLTVESDANAAAALEAAPPDDSADVARLLPPGFTAQTAQAEAIAINGSNDATNLDRGLLN